VKNYSAGNIKYYLPNWKLITNDKYILEIVSVGLKLEFIEGVDMPSCKPYTIKYSLEEAAILDREIEKLLVKKVIRKCDQQESDFFSSVFLRPKKNGEHRMILNLKKFNSFINTKHFKMETIQQVIDMIKEGVWMASVDLKDAYYTVPIYKDHQKFLKFFKDTPYQFTSLPNGYGPAMRAFTKLLKPPFAILRNYGFLSVVYVDDSYLQGNTYEACLKNVIETVKVLDNLGFTIHIEKSVLTPTQSITFLGFVFDSVAMTMTLCTDKKIKILEICKNLSLDKSFTIRQIAVVLGNLTASMEAVPYGKLFYRHIEKEKIIALRKYKGNFEAKLKLSAKAKLQLKWWQNNIDKSFRSLRPLPVDKIIYTDASSKGWGAHLGDTETGGMWKPLESENHINYLELLAILFGLKALIKNFEVLHIRIMSDNTTAVAYINNMGGIKSMGCNAIAFEIWSWARVRNIWLSAAHIPGVANVIADSNSRIFSHSSEWSINKDIFNTITNYLGKPDIDLFATRLNNKTINFISWKPDPEALAVDAFTINWDSQYNYCFPPFSLVSKVLSKLGEMKDSNAILVVPFWKTQPWYPVLVSMLTSHPIIIGSSMNYITLPNYPNNVHPLHPKLKLLVAQVSSNPLTAQKFLKQHGMCCSLHGGREHVSVTTHPFPNGPNIVVAGKLIHCFQI